MPTLARHTTYDTDSNLNNHNITGFNASGTNGLLVVKAMSKYVDETGFEVQVDGTAIDHQVTIGGDGTAGTSIWTTVIDDASVDVTVHIPSWKQASAIVEYWEGVDQSTPIANTFSKSAWSSAMTDSVTGASADNELVYGINTQNNRDLTIATGGTEIAQFNGAGGIGAVAGGHRASSTSAQDVGWTAGSGDNYRLAVVELAKGAGDEPEPDSNVSVKSGGTFGSGATKVKVSGSFVSGVVKHKSGGTFS